MKGKRSFIKIALIVSALFLILLPASCEWLSNPDDNPNRPAPEDTEKGRWNQSEWGKSKWN